MAGPTEDVYCTLLMSDSYLPGAAVLAHSLRDCGTAKKIACLVTLDSLLYNTITQLKTLFDYVIPVQKVANPNLENLARLERLDLRFAFTKIALWQQARFRKIVYIDCDVVALRAPDELFDIKDPFAAAPDIGWPDCFNSGVMLLSPNDGDYWSLQTLAASGTSFDGADQGLFNEYFGNRPWHRLSFTYNCTPSSSYQYEPAFRHFRSSIKMAHFIGKDKPWTMGRRVLSSSPSPVFRELLGYWWSVYDRHYRVSASTPGGPLASELHLQQLVKDEEVHDVLNRQAPLAADAHHKMPEALTSTTEIPMSAPDDQLDALHHGESHRQNHSSPFVAPENPWDATRSAPPSQSQPEAQTFPSQHYSMSSDTHLFTPPTSYPEPPANLYYAVPPRPRTPEKPKPIFPWEQNTQKPTRVFAEPETQPSAPLDHTSRPTTLDEVPGAQAASEDKDKTDAAPALLLSPSSAPGTFESGSQGNAWDNDDSIEAYVRAVRDLQGRRGKVQALSQGNAQGSSTKSSTESARRPEATNRASLRLTDFPTEVERPSLPVTPAPIRRPMFWGEERDEQGHLPSAAGVPEQQDWNPIERLEQLRKSSLITAAELPKAEGEGQDLPQREFIGSSIPPEGMPIESRSDTILGPGPSGGLEERPPGVGAGLIGGGLSVGSFGNTGFQSASSSRHAISSTSEGGSAHEQTTSNISSSSSHSFSSTSYSKTPSSESRRSEHGGGR